MKAIIPVAGQGTRLSPHTDHTQKCLLPVGGRPVLGHILDGLVDSGVDEVVLIVGHLGTQVEEFCREYPLVQFTFARQTERQGLGHAIKLGLHDTTDPVLVMLGDTIFDMDLDRLIASRHASIGVVEVPDPERFGIIETDGDRITCFLEKPENPPTNLAIAGVYYFPHQDLLFHSVQYLIDHDIRTRGEIQLTDALQHMVESGVRFEYQHIDHWLDCGLPETFISTNRFLLQQRGSSYVSPEATLIDSTVINSHISAGCYIQNSHLEDVIMLEDARVVNTAVHGEIIGKGDIVG